ncbi:MAG: phosphoribosylglycinamide synthetase C domain-containing protein [Planctomycetota bacterium]
MFPKPRNDSASFIPFVYELQVFHAGTTRAKNGRLSTSGGRVLGVTATAASLPEAAKRAYAAVERISFAGAHFRRDIGARALSLKPDA